jgi:hypothetical protein
MEGRGGEGKGGDEGSEKKREVLVRNLTHPGPAGSTKLRGATR